MEREVVRRQLDSMQERERTAFKEYWNSEPRTLERRDPKRWQCSSPLIIKAPPSSSLDHRKADAVGKNSADATSPSTTSGPLHHEDNDATSKSGINAAGARSVQSQIIAYPVESKPQNGRIGNDNVRFMGGEAASILSRRYLQDLVIICRLGVVITTRPSHAPSKHVQTVGKIAGVLSAGYYEVPRATSASEGRQQNQELLTFNLSISYLYSLQDSRDCS
ncbi:hypothetical protein BDQ17DRAFT_1404634 [Cyathus striatus]|nr:hypothetical protein BDQ17DRAFT_1404634 [Cyathus striatus]